MSCKWSCPTSTINRWSTTSITVREAKREHSKLGHEVMPSNDNWKIWKPYTGPAAELQTWSILWLSDWIQWIRMTTRTPCFQSCFHTRHKLSHFLMRPHLINMVTNCHYNDLLSNVVTLDRYEETFLVVIFYNFKFYYPATKSNIHITLCPYFFLQPLFPPYI